MTELETLATKTKELAKKCEEVDNLRKELENEKSKLIITNKGAHMHDSIERKTLSYFRCPNVKKLLEINTCDAKFSAVPYEIKENVIALKKDIETARIISQIFYGDSLDQDGEKDIAANCRHMLSTKFAKEYDIAARIKAFGSTTTNAGDEFVPTLMANTYIDEYKLERQVSGLFRSIPMESNPYDMPFLYDSLKAKKVSEGAAATAANFSTNKLTFTAIKGVEYIELPEELNEDSAPSIINICSEQVVQSQIYGVEAASVNGDTTATHMDSDYAAESSAIAEKWWKGLRKLALQNTANGSCVDFGGGVSTLKLDAMRAAMGKFGVNVRSLAWIVSSNAWCQMLGLDEISTVDKFGPMASIATGTLAAFRGIPVIISENMRSDLNASGVYDGTTTNNTCVILVNTSRFFIGQRRPIKVRVMQDSNLGYDRWLMSSTQRVAFNGFTQSSTEVSVVLGYNITI